MSKEITSVEEFREAIKETCVVDFYMDDCPNCKALEPIIDSLEVDVPIYKFKISREISMAIRDVCVVMGAPTLIMFNGGYELFRVTGLIKKDDLWNAIMSYK